MIALTVGYYHCATHHAFVARRLRIVGIGTWPSALSLCFTQPNANRCVSVKAMLPITYILPFRDSKGDAAMVEARE